MITGADFIALLPLLILAATSIVIMLAVALRRHHGVSAIVAFAGLAIAFASLWGAATVAPRQVTPLLLIDRYALFYIGLILAASMAFVLLAYDYFRQCEGDPDEIYILMLVAALGSAVLASSNHLVSLFLGLELLSVSLYAMISYLHTRPLAIEAGVKYLVLAAVSAAFLLFGIALLYAALGTMDLARMAAMLSSGGAYDRQLVLPGLALVITGLGFKLAVVPFHLWTPDVYEGAPSPVTAYIATVSKGAIFAVLLRSFYRSGAHGFAPIFIVFSIIALASMYAGNILALQQKNVKRMLAYSSIAHLGYLLVAFQAAGDLGPSAVTFYLVAYFVTTLGAFGVISALSAGGSEPMELDDYRGLFWRRPVVAGVFTAMLLSLAGIPLTAGFLGKFYLLAAGASAAMWALVISLVVTSSIGLYYYLRVVVTLYARPETSRAAEPRLHAAPNVILAVLTVLLFWFGIFPHGLLGLIRAAVAGVA
jgi:NADH-quinone oxidoreductase subunit N